MIKRVLLVLSLLLVGCPKPPPPTVMVVPASQPAVAVLPAESPPPAVTRASFALTPGTTQTATTTGAVPHTVEIKLLRIALIECTSETLAQESLAPNPSLTLIAYFFLPRHATAFELWLSHCPRILKTSNFLIKKTGMDG